MTSHKLAVSAIIPVFDGAAYLGEAITSVLGQTRPPDELLIVDDGSTDDSARLARRLAPEALVDSAPHAGIGAARNRGLDLAQKGNLIAFLDADDVWTPDKLERQLAALARDSSVDIVTGMVEHFYSADLDSTVRRRIECPAGPMVGHHFGAMLIRRRAFEQAGRLRTDLVVGEVIDWCARASDLGVRTTVLPGVVMKRRLHAANHGRRQRQAAPDYARLLKFSLDRRRMTNHGTERMSPCNP